MHDLHAAARRHVRRQHHQRLRQPHPKSRKWRLPRRRDLLSRPRRGSEHAGSLGPAESDALRGALRRHEQRVDVDAVLVDHRVCRGGGGHVGVGVVCPRHV